MKYHITYLEDIKSAVIQGLKENNGYCPCVIKSKGKPEFKCPCKEFREEIPINQPCYCGLYIKDEQ